jgi:hypothetical protein
MSSRNERLTDKSRRIFNTQSRKENSKQIAPRTTKWVKNHLTKNPSFDLEYFQLQMNNTPAEKKKLKIPRFYSLPSIT